MGFGIVLTAIVVSSVISVLIGFLFSFYVKRNLNQLEKSRSWKESSYKEVLSPLYINFRRLKFGYGRIVRKESISYAESQLIFEAHTEIREIIKTKKHLIPSELIEDSIKMIFFLDAWFEEYHTLRLEKKPIVKLCIIGVKGYPYPNPSEKSFIAFYETYKKELYNI